jgi:hypothetical protein
MKEVAMQMGRLTLKKSATIYHPKDERRNSLFDEGSDKPQRLTLI